MITQALPQCPSL